MREIWLPINQVQPGQIWKDNDKRTQRTLLILTVSDGYAYVECKETSRRTKIRLNRFNPNRQTGYTLVKDND